MEYTKLQQTVCIQFNFYRPDGKKFGHSFYQTIVNQVKQDTMLENGDLNFGYDGEDNFVEQPND
ncbi:hypothetical protein KHA80_06540 [Anaerobacillus sp. HL2]|nr:hypothetical protein KHA80_06540 [Anaerobacillus sp. HL2]